MKRRFLILLATIGVSFGIYFLVSATLPKDFIPEEFSESRIRGAELARSIVELSSSSLASLEEIARLDDWPKDWRDLMANAEEGE